jgi:hypothetical protein
MGKLRIFAAAALLFGAFGASQADTLQMQGVSADDGNRPTRGMTAASVESKFGTPDAKVSKFGTPDAKVSPVGDPPISRWEYKDMVVFFEYDRVIHAVVKRKKS